MAGPDGQTPDSLIDALEQEPFGFDFFTALRRLQAVHSGLPRIGHAILPAEEPVRFAQSPALDFPPSTLEKVERHGPDRPPVLFSRHFGLFGPNGPLPFCLTEYARERIHHHRDPTFAAFCNVFHHRLTSFFFRSWADARREVDLDRADDSHWRYFVGSTIGLGMETFWNRDSIPDKAKYYYAGRLVQQSRGPEGLAAIVEDFFGVKAEVQTFVGRWMDLPPGCACQLGASRSTGTLGSTAIVGSRMWNCQLAFRLKLGPLHLADFERLLPVNKSFRRLRDWVRLYVGESFTWDVQLVLARDEVPRAQLGHNARLGWLTWLKTESFAFDPEGLILQGSEG
jgi:type VI secretion system protein ImpH